jgi:hypothetical protein
VLREYQRSSTVLYDWEGELLKRNYHVANALHIICTKRHSGVYDPTAAHAFFDLALRSASQRLPYMGILAGRVFTSLTKRDQNVLWQRNGIEHPRKTARVFDGEQERRHADLLDQLGRGLWFYCVVEFKVR